ncbi:methyltransferase domain-containing protein [Streptomyces sp. BBFR115]|uniref:methyltransferase domain-containing protein n=1 Tax=Streptomyces sp. BBFR115 TaxID=3448173 RepID=UPI003F77666C
MIQVVEHVPQERPYAIGAELAAAGLPVRVCRVWAGDAVPRTTDGMVALVVMGGPMSAYAEPPARGGPSAPGEPPAPGLSPGPGDFPSRADELALLRAALEAEVPVLGVCLGAQLLAVAAGGVARPGNGPQIGWGEVAMTEAAHDDPLFAAVPDRLRVLHWHGDTMDLPPGATLLASCDRYPVQAFRIGGSAWGVQFHLEVDGTAVEAFAGTFPEEAATAPGLLESAPAELAALARHRDDVFERFAAFVAGRAERTATRAFFTRRAAAWEERFADDNPRYAAAVRRMGLRPGQRVLDLGCGTGRALPALRAEVGAGGVVAGVDLTPAMLTAAVREGRDRDGGLLAADACRLPLPSGAVHGVFSAGLLDHVPDPAAALREWARVTAPGGVLLLFHPSGRAERAARHGRPLDPADPLAEENLRPALRAAGWDPLRYEDARHHFLARAVRAGGRDSGRRPG